jgi:hypothetical protein
MKTLKLTKKLETLFARWAVKVRTNPTTIRHMVYEKDITVEPLPFAVFETAVKAIAWSWEVAEGVDDNYKLQRWGWDSEIARRGVFSLVTRANVSSQQATDDYHYCSGWLRDAGLYYDLLD